MGVPEVAEALRSEPPGVVPTTAGAAREGGRSPQCWWRRDGGVAVLMVRPAVGAASVTVTEVVAEAPTALVTVKT